MIYLDEKTTAALISHELAYKAVKAAFSSVQDQHSSIFPVVNASGPIEGSMFSLKSACTNQLLGWKMGSYWPCNNQFGRPNHGTHIFLLSPDTGEMKAILSASLVNAYRTAAADAIAVDLLARQDSSVLALFGTGHQAKYEALAISKVRNLSKVLIVGRNQTNANQLEQELSKEGLTTDIKSAQEACESADIIVTVTASTAPLFESSWVKPGTHISAMGADKIGKQELPPSLFENATLYCDYLSQSKTIGEFQHAPDKEIYQIGDKLQLKERNKNDTTIFDSSGIAYQDLYVAQMVLDKYLFKEDYHE